MIIRTIDKNSLLYYKYKKLLKLNIKLISNRIYSRNYVNHFIVQSLALLFEKFNFITKYYLIKNYTFSSININTSFFVFMVFNKINFNIPTTNFLEKEKING